MNESTTFQRFPAPGTTRTLDELLAMDIPPGERAYTHAQIVTTIGERGARLPLGLAALQAGEELQPSFICRPPITRVRKDVTRKVREAQQHNRSPGYARAAFVAASLEAMGVLSFDSEPDDKRLGYISRLPFGDVAYAIYFLESLIEDGERKMDGINYTCGACHKVVREPTIDLGRRKITTFEYTPEAPPRAVFRPRRPFRIGQRLVERLVLGPAPYARTHLNASAEDLAGSPELDILVLTASVRGSQEGNLPPITESGLDEMHTKDQVEAAHVASALSCEPGALLEHDCPMCGATNNLMRSWMAPDFFGESKS
jgi:hypothetical protein